MSSKRGEFAGRIAVVGDRELVLGYSLLGVQDTFIADKENASKLLTNLMSQPEYTLIVVSSAVKRQIPASLRERLEASVAPLVVFTPDPYSEGQEEPLSELARRVLGVDLKGGKN